MSSSTTWSFIFQDQGEVLILLDMSETYSDFNTHILPLHCSSDATQVKLLKKLISSGKYLKF